MQKVRVDQKDPLWGICVCGSFVLEAYENGTRIIEVPISIDGPKNGMSHRPSPFSGGGIHGEQLSTITCEKAFTKVICGA